MADSLFWKRTLPGPFISSAPGTVAPDGVTTPDILVLDGKVLVYTGAIAGDKERLILLSISPKALSAMLPGETLQSARVIVSAGPRDFDCKHVFDPAVINFGGKVCLFYSAIGLGEDSIGLAVSDDGDIFTKNDNPILVGRSPEAVVLGNVLFLLYVLKNRSGKYAIHSASSTDGVTFKVNHNNPVLSPGKAGDWDESEVTTPRIIKINGTFFMVYAGVNKKNANDIPAGFGLARSTDLAHWEKYPQNPVFSIGESGSWDDGAVWFGTPFCVNEDLYLIYEGGRLENIIDRTPALTQVGLAKMPLKSFQEVITNWEQDHQ